MAATNILERAYHSHNDGVARKKLLQQANPKSTSKTSKHLPPVEKTKPPPRNVTDEYHEMLDRAKNSINTGATRKNANNKGSRKMSKHNAAIHGFDKWLNTVLDTKTKEKMVNQFGYSFSQKNYRSNEIDGGNGANDSNDVNNPPTIRSHKLFESLSSNCSF